MENDYGSSTFIYKPPSSTPQAIDAKMFVKFSKSSFLLLSFLKQWNIPYEESELEETAFGLALRYKMDDGSLAERFKNNPLQLKGDFN